MDELRRSELVSYALVDELAMFLRTSGSTLCLAEAIARAVKFWMAAQAQEAVARCGYQWKSVFLPAGTRLRMHYVGEVFYAEIVEEEFHFRGLASSPHRMTVAVAGPGRNAWLDNGCGGPATGTGHRRTSCGAQRNVRRWRKLAPCRRLRLRPPLPRQSRRRQRA